MILDTVQDYDVAIVGAGPAGSSLAIRLALSGLKVSLVEQKKFPREKLCGEFISPECLTHFAELGVMAEIVAASGTELAETTFFARNGRAVSVKSEWFGTSDTMALGLSRAEMDQRLMDRARDLGIDVREETNAIGLIVTEDKVAGVRVRSKGGHETGIEAAVTVDATGRTRSLVKRIERLKSPRHPARFVAFKTHLRNARVKAGACEIYSYIGGYGGCNRIEGDLFNLCFIASTGQTKSLESDPERVMREVVFNNTRAAEAMSNAEVIKPWLAVPIERFGRGDLVPLDGLLTVGDSAAFIDPFTGSGILLALESSKLAARAVIEHLMDFTALAAAYRKDYSSAFDRRLRICSLLRHAAFAPRLAEAVITILGTSSGLRRQIARSTRFRSDSGT